MRLIKKVSLMLCGMAFSSSALANPTPPKAIQDSYKVLKPDQAAERFGYALQAPASSTSYPKAEAIPEAYEVLSLQEYRLKNAKASTSASLSKAKTGASQSVQPVEITPLDQAFAVAWEEPELANQTTPTEEIVLDAAQSLQTEINYSDSPEAVAEVVQKWQSLEPKLQSVIAKERELNELLDYFNRLKRVKQSD